MSGCGSLREKFSEYLDGRLTGVEMQRIAAHLEDCRGCAAEWYAHQGRLPRHQRRQGPHLVQVDVRMIADPTLEGTA